jgi:outer membrane protein assembly factor BamB
LTSLPADTLKARVRWRASVGEAPKKDYYGLRLATAGQHLYAADGAGRISAFNSGTGRKVWQTQTQPRLVAGVGLGGTAVLAGTLDGEVIAVSSEAGTPLWRVGITSEVLAAPLGDADIVVARSGDGRLHGLAAVDGRQLWTFDRAVPTLSLRGTSRPVVADGRVYAGLDTGKLVALDLNSGQLLWEESVSAPSGRSEIERLVDLDADPVLVEGDLFAVSYGGQLIALDAANGKLQWRQEVSSYSGLAVDGDRVYASDHVGRVWALDRATGAVQWKQEGLKLRGLTSPVIHEGWVAVGDFEGYVHWLSPEDGSLRGRLKASRSVLNAPPLVSGGGLYVLGRGGDITAIELPGSG